MKAVKEIKLQNGLTVINQNYQSVNNVNISLFFRVGPFYETDGVYGITHIVEHMFFRRLNKMSQEELYYQTESIGTTLRGTTYRNCVIFDMTISKINIKSAAMILKRVLEPFTWKKDDFDKEIQVVKNQIDLKVKTFIECVNEMYFDTEKTNIPIMGELSDVEKISLKEVNLWKNKYFVCSNACVVISGDFCESDFESVLSILGSVDNKGEKQKTIYFSPPDYKKRNFESDNIIIENYDSADIWITFDIEGIPTKEYYGAGILTSILGQGDGSILSMKIRETDFFTDEIYASTMNFYGTGRILIECSCSNDNIENILDAIFGCICKIKNEITERNYLSTIPFFTTNLSFMYNDPRELNYNIGLNRFILNNKNWSIENDFVMYENLSILKLKEYANKIFKPENMTINMNINDEYVSYKEIKKKVRQFRNKL